MTQDVTIPVKYYRANAGQKSNRPDYLILVAVIKDHDSGRLMRYSGAAGAIAAIHIRSSGRSFRRTICGNDVIGSPRRTCWRSGRPRWTATAPNISRTRPYPVKSQKNRIPLRPGSAAAALTGNANPRHPRRGFFTI